MAQPETTPSSVDSPPDWSKVDYELHCPLCDYNLFGLENPRCPECGYPFEWAEVLDPRRRAHPYLFEHHPEANVWSYRRTVVGALSPRQFWASVHPSQPSRLKRLLVYWVLGAFAYTVAVIVCDVLLVGTHSYVTWSSSISRGWASSSLLGHIIDDVVIFLRFGLALTLRTWVLIPLSVPCFLWLSLMIFRVSMRRARVNSIHVLRCVVYCTDPIAWAFLAAVVSVTAAAPIAAGLTWQDYSNEIGLLLAILWAIFVFYRLYVAFKLYLRFAHAAAAVSAAFVIVTLVAANLFFLLTIWI